MPETGYNLPTGAGQLNVRSGNLKDSLCGLNMVLAQTGYTTLIYVKGKLFPFKFLFKNLYNSYRIERARTSKKKKITGAGVETIRHPRRNVFLRLLKCHKLEQIFETVVIASRLAVLKRFTGLFFLRKGRLKKKKLK